jgi:acetyl-CoA C-acetyltransferase
VVRTPTGKLGGSLQDFATPDLAVIGARASLDRGGIAGEEIDAAIFGHARQAGNGPNPARQIAVRAGIPVPACALNMTCASGSGGQSRNKQTQRG